MVVVEDDVVRVVLGGGGVLWMVDGEGCSVLLVEERVYSG